MILQPVRESLNKSIDVIYCKEEDITSQALTNLSDSRVPKRLKNRKAWDQPGQGRKRRHQHHPMKYEIARTYCSLVAEEVDDVSQEYRREPKDFNDVYRTDYKLFNQDEREIDPAILELEVFDVLLCREDSLEMCFKEPAFHRKMVPSLKESSTHWFYNPA